MPSCDGSYNPQGPCFQGNSPLGKQELPNCAKLDVTFTRGIDNGWGFEVQAGCMSSQTRCSPPLVVHLKRLESFLRFMYGVACNDHLLALGAPFDTIHLGDDIPLHSAPRAEGAGGC